VPSLLVAKKLSTALRSDHWQGRMTQADPTIPYLHIVPAARNAIGIIPIYILDACGTLMAVEKAPNVTSKKFRLAFKSCFQPIEAADRYSRLAISHGEGLHCSYTW
jgi:hypothetical protein